MKLTASDIHVELGGNEILKGIDAAIKEKEFVGITDAVKNSFNGILVEAIHLCFVFHFF